MKQIENEPLTRSIFAESVKILFLLEMGFLGSQAFIVSSHKPFCPPKPILYLAHLLHTNTYRAKSLYIIKSRGEQFLWNRNWDLGCFLGGWQYWKKKLWPIMSNFCGQFFPCFHRQKKLLNFFEKNLASSLKSCLKWRWKKK